MSQVSKQNAHAQGAQDRSSGVDRRRHLTEKVSQIRLIGPRSLDENMIPLISMKEHSVVEGIMEYPEYIEQLKMYAQWGTFIDYALRRVINRITREPAIDSRCEDVINGIYNTGSIECDPNILSRISRAYVRYRDPTISTLNALNDIWVVSLSHSAWFGRSSEDGWKSQLDLRLNVDDRVLLVSRLKGMIAGLGDVIYDTLYEKGSSQSFKELSLSDDKSSRDDKARREVRILTNPNLSHGSTMADADLIIDDFIIDFKCSKHDPVNTRNFCQLLGYAALARKLSISKALWIVVLNPLSGKIYVQSIHAWNELAYYDHILGS